MQNCLDGNDILILSTHIKGKFVFDESFIRSLNVKICKNVTANDSKSYLGYLKKLVDEYCNTYYCSIGKKPIDCDYSVFTEETKSSYKVHRFKISDKVRISKYNNIFSKGCNNIVERNICGWFCVKKLILGRIKLKMEKQYEKAFYEKALLLSKLKKSYYSEPGSHISDKVNVVWDYASTK